MIKIATLLCVPALLLALIAASTSSTDPQEAARLNNIGVAYMNQQLFEKGLKAFEEAAVKDPNLKVSTLNRGVAMLNLQRIDDAKALLQKAAQDDPKDPHPWYNLGLYYKNSDSPQAAVDAFRRVTELDPNDADAWYFLGSTHAQLKLYPEAIDAFEHALKIDPLHASAQFGLSRTYQQSGQADKAREGLKKFQYITQNKLGTPISLAYGEQGKYSRAEESPVAVEKVGAAIPVRFVDATADAGLKSKAAGQTSDLASFLGPGACFLDYDGDGQIDLLLADNGPEGGLALLHNNGGKFEDVSKKAGLDPTMHAIGCTAGDYDNDGFVDIVLGINGRISLMHNEKSGTFRDVTEASGIKSDGFNAGVTFIDYDHDGDLDLYVARYADASQFDPRTPRSWDVAGVQPAGLNVMWRNNGNGAFTDVTQSAGVSGGTPSVAAVGTDYNNDRAVDLAIAGWSMGSQDGNLNTYLGTFIYENPREGKFPRREVWSSPMPAPAAGLAVLDFNHDGWMDLAFTHWGPPGLTLWHNNQGKSFDQVKLPETNWVRAYGVTAIDYDNNGWIDLVAVGETKDGKGEVRVAHRGLAEPAEVMDLPRVETKPQERILVGGADLAAIRPARPFEKS